MRENFHVIFLRKISQGIVSDCDKEFTSEEGEEEDLLSSTQKYVYYIKNHLDIVLSSFPDQLTMTGLGRATDSNSNLLVEL